MATEIPRVAVFDDWLVFKVIDRSDVDVDDPSTWAASLDHPGLRAQGPIRDGEQYYVIDDPRVLLEVERIIRFETCAICRGPMTERDTWVEGDQVFVCLGCGYWGGLGNREWNSHQRVEPGRGAIGRYRSLDPLDSASTDFLVTHLKRFRRRCRSFRRSALRRSSWTCCVSFSMLRSEP